MWNSGLFWGIDIGGSYTKVGCLNEKEFVLADTFSTGENSTPDSVLSRAAGIILRNDPAPAAVGIGTAGLINRQSGLLVCSPNLPLWSGVDVRSVLQKYLNAPVTLDNDCNVFAIGAINSGEIPRKGLWLFITLGTGIGGTVISEGSILYGTGGSGEFGHTTVREGGLPCACGSSGCWERYAGRKALEWYYRRLTGCQLSPVEISDLAASGDTPAREAYREFGRWFGIGLANLANCFAPSGFFIAGGLSAGLSHFGIPARQEYKRRCRHPWSVTLLEDSQDAGAYGAASMVRGSCC